MKRDAPATQRNRGPILQVLERWLREPARVLEIASGTGQHAVFFAAALPHVRWQPSDADSSSLESICAWVDEAGLPNLAPPLLLDARSSAWPTETFDAIFNANMIHISPWEVAVGLFAGAEHSLRPGGRLFLYGPFKVDGAHTAPSNQAFDADLRRRDPSWGVRDLEAVAEEARARGLTLVERNDLPANNKLLVFERAGVSEVG